MWTPPGGQAGSCPPGSPWPQAAPSPSVALAEERTCLQRHSVPPYTVIAPDGEWLGTVEAPPGFRVLDVAAALVLGMEVDEVDVERVVVYEFVADVRHVGQPMLVERARPFPESTIAHRSDATGLRVHSSPI